MRSWGGVKRLGAEAESGEFLLGERDGCGDDLWFGEAEPRVELDAFEFAKEVFGEYVFVAEDLFV